MERIGYKGFDKKEIKKMSIEEFAKIATARIRRSLKRGFTEEQKKFLENIRKNPNKFHKTHHRDMVIVPEMIGVKIGVYNGKEFVPVEIKPEMLGHRLGEFALTRKQVKHSAPGFGATRSSKYIPLK
ncbi:MAG: 30S ribosomal protein S19 [Candidatus Aenigmatarchaeota archaeon]|nr:MAG: 30S ribosomal protein S19 [Candidatus Aenigmarchaeota archaeon]